MTGDVIHPAGPISDPGPTAVEPRIARVMVVGGYGNTGRGICQGLAARKDVRLVIAGPDLGRAQALADELRDLAVHPVAALHFDARRSCALPAEVDLVVNAASQALRAPAIVEAALAVGADALDTNLSSPAKWIGLRALQSAIEAAGRCVITDAGLHPGVPGALARWIAADGARLRSAHIGGAFALDWRALRFSDSAIAEFAAELASMNPSTLQAGCWHRSYASQRRIDFGPPAGRRSCTPMMLEEVRELATRMPSLRDAGFYVAGFGWRVDYLAMPACMLLARIGPASHRTAGRLLVAALRRWGGTDRSAVLVLDADGVAADGAPLSVRARVAHADAYALTATCVVATVEQWLAGRRPRGLWTQAAYVEPAGFFARLRELGAAVSMRSTAALAAGG